MRKIRQTIQLNLHRADRLTDFWWVLSGYYLAASSFHQSIIVGLAIRMIAKCQLLLLARLLRFVLASQRYLESLALRMRGGYVPVDHVGDRLPVVYQAPVLDRLGDVLSLGLY